MKKTQPSPAKTPRIFAIEEWTKDIRRFIQSKYNLSPDDVDDLAQEVIVRVIEQQRTNPYDPSRGAISTYLWWQVRSVVYAHVQRAQAARNQEVSFEDTFVEAFRDENRPTTAQLADPGDALDDTLAEADHFIKFVESKQGADFPRPSNVFSLLLEGWSLNDLLRHGRRLGDDIWMPGKGGATWKMPKLSDVSTITELKAAKRRVGELAERYALEGGAFGFRLPW